MTNSLIINKVEYKVVDTKEKMTVPDCNVVLSNKIWTWHWEAKFYIWQESEEIREIFWKEWFNDRWFFLKKDLLNYLEEVKSEYKNPNQEYIKKDLLSEKWDERFSIINWLDEVLFFDFSETVVKWPRIYINSKDKYYQLFRELSLPNITYLSTIKLEWKKWENIFYFRLFVDYFDEYESPYIIEEEKKVFENNYINETEKTQIVRARKWQWLYRKKLLEECPFCPITMIWDDRLLIASHIKPWAKSELGEKTDPKNGFMLTPTYDLLFDRWYISFTDDKKMIISPWLSKMTCSKLNISPDKKYTMLPTEWREIYLEYHRKNLLKN